MIPRRPPHHALALMAALGIAGGAPAADVNGWLGTLLSVVACWTADGAPLSGAWS